jgi:hypothetical protein
MTHSFFYFFFLNFSLLPRHIVSFFFFYHWIFIKYLVKFCWCLLICKIKMFWNIHWELLFQKLWCRKIYCETLLLFQIVFVFEYPIFKNNSSTFVNFLKILANYATFQKKKKSVKLGYSWKNNSLNIYTYSMCWFEKTKKTLKLTSQSYK